MSEEHDPLLDLLPDDLPQPPPKKVGRKVSRAEVEERVNLAAQMLCRRYTRFEIHRALKNHYRRPDGGSLSTNACDRCLQRAREVLRRRYALADDPEAAGAAPEKLRDLHRRDAFGLYESVIRDPDAEPQHKLAAQARIDRLLGLEAPLKVAQTDPSGEKEALVRFRQTAVVLAPARELLALMAERAAGLGDALPGGALPENVVDAEVIRGDEGSPGGPGGGQQPDRGGRVPGANVHQSGGQDDGPERDARPGQPEQGHGLPDEPPLDVQ
jgi:hypothetical protein